MVHKSGIKFWLALLIIFLLVFLLSYASLRAKTGVIGIMPYYIEDWLVMVLSTLGIIEAVIELIKHKRL